MGLFGNILKGLGRIAGSFLGIPAQVARSPTARQLAAQAAAAGVGAAVGGAVVGVNVDAQGRPISLPHPGAITGGNALTFRRTLVQSIDRATGKVLSSETLRGSPFIMRHDIQIARRVIRTASKLGRMRGIRHAVKQSVSSKLKEAIERKALDQVLGGKDC